MQVHVLHGTSGSPTHLPDDLTVTNAVDTTCEYPGGIHRSFTIHVVTIRPVNP